MHHRSSITLQAPCIPATSDHRRAPAHSLHRPRLRLSPSSVCAASFARRTIVRKAVSVDALRTCQHLVPKHARQSARWTGWRAGRGGSQIWGRRISGIGPGHGEKHSSSLTGCAPSCPPSFLSRAANCSGPAKSAISIRRLPASADRQPCPGKPHAIVDPAAVLAIARLSHSLSRTRWVGWFANRPSNSSHNHPAEPTPHPHTRRTGTPYAMALSHPVPFFFPNLTLVHSSTLKHSRTFRAHSPLIF